MSSRTSRTSKRSRSTSHSDRCCNPYEQEGHKGKSLRNLSAAFRELFPEMPIGAKIW